MSLSRLHIVTPTVIALVAVPVVSHAQRVDDGTDRFFAAKVDKSQKDAESTLIQGSLTSTTFFASEFGDAPLLNNDTPTIDNYSDARRIFTDMRAQLDVKHISGSAWDMRMDARVRVNLPCDFNTLADPATTSQDVVEENCRTQSGSFGENEYDVRELFAKRTGAKTDLFIGRQYVHELASTKLDGIKFQYKQSKRWSLLGFGGLSPSKVSRSVLDDYPAQIKQIGGTVNAVEDGRILPIAAGLGGSYRYPNVYGNLGVSGIVPLADDRKTGLNEAPRVFLSENGYWRPSGVLDVYHYLVVDLQSADGLALTNASLGVNYQPIPAMRVTAAVNRVDTETLNSIAQTEILDVADNGTTTAYNYQQVLRAASNWARLGVSVSFAKQRFEVSTSGQVRQREALMLESPGDGQDVDIPGTQAAEFLVSVVDRRSVAGLRIGASFMAIFPIGDNMPNRSNSKIIRAHTSRMFADEKGEFEVDVSLLLGDDSGLGACANNVLECYGQSSITALSLGGTVFYRFARSWFGIAHFGFSNHSLSDSLANDTATRLINGFARIAYRF